MAKSPRARPKDKENGPEVSLSAPWLERCERSNFPIYLPNTGSRFYTEEGMESFVRTRTELHALYIRETHLTRRIAMCVAAALLGLACLIPILAPAGRETISYWIGLALFVFSAGSMGYSSIRLASEKRQLALSKDS